MRTFIIYYSTNPTDPRVLRSDTHYGMDHFSPPSFYPSFFVLIIFWPALKPMPPVANRGIAAPSGAWFGLSHVPESIQTPST